MSPYRVLVKFRGRSDEEVLSAMLSVDKTTQDRNIYIIQKAVPSDDLVMTHKTIAHMQSGKSNSVILEKYQIIKDYNLARAYRVKCCSTCESPLETEFTQQDCLKLAMLHYCEHNGITILNTL